MGGDHGPRVIVSALLESLSQHSNVKALLFGDRDELASQLKNCSDTSVVSRIEVRHSDCCVADTDKPSTVIRNKRDSSMGLALQALANNEADAFVSAGNTGAMMALGLYYVKPCRVSRVRQSAPRFRHQRVAAMCSIWGPISTARRSSSTSLPCSVH